MDVQLDFEIGHTVRIRPRNENDIYTHEWNAYVSGVNRAPIYVYIKEVKFIICGPDYRSSQVVSDPPFRVEAANFHNFNLSIELHFRDPTLEFKVFHFNVKLSKEEVLVKKVAFVNCIFQNLKFELGAFLLEYGGKELPKMSCNQHRGNVEAYQNNCEPAHNIPYTLKSFVPASMNLVPFMGNDSNSTEHQAKPIPVNNMENLSGHSNVTKSHVSNKLKRQHDAIKLNKISFQPYMKENEISITGFEKNNIQEFSRQQPICRSVNNNKILKISHPPNVINFQNSFPDNENFNVGSNPLKHKLSNQPYMEENNISKKNPIQEFSKQKLIRGNVDYSEMLNILQPSNVINFEKQFPDSDNSTICSNPLKRKSFNQPYMEQNNISEKKKIQEFSKQKPLRGNVGNNEMLNTLQPLNEINFEIPFPRFGKLNFSKSVGSNGKYDDNQSNKIFNEVSEKSETSKRDEILKFLQAPNAFKVNLPKTFKSNLKNPLPIRKHAKNNELFKLHQANSFHFDFPKPTPVIVESNEQFESTVTSHLFNLDFLKPTNCSKKENEQENNYLESSAIENKPRKKQRKRTESVTSETYSDTPKKIRGKGRSTE